MAPPELSNEPITPGNLAVRYVTPEGFKVRAMVPGMMLEEPRHVIGARLQMEDIA